ncbi:uncharacterized protein LOC103720895 [Phoenix dactylifera]|uniref:Uncharacterized protein LOC103720895 n=1 Tax=Phoenix dactylifera TaxID=42345 RepID=A0A8B7CYC8_PHODC|nr:uncharacterized protein LOC103720895 [Phoenix dactylifera]
MAKTRLFSPNPGGISLDSKDFWRQSGGGGWATAIVVVVLLSWQLLRAFSRRRAPLSGDPKSIPIPTPTTPSSTGNPSLGFDTKGISNIISDADLKDLITSLEGKLKEKERWEDVIDKKNSYISYNAKCCRPKGGPLKYLSVTTFERCSTELLRDFYMDNEYRKVWDKTLIKHDQLQADEMSGTEIGRMIKKFPLLTPREYLLAWRVWEGTDKTFYCYIRDCEHPLVPRQRKYVRVGFFRSGWRIRKIPGRDACEITMVHQEDAGLNVEMAKLAFAKGIWNYVCKMNNALREYTPRIRSRSTSVATLLRLIQKVPPMLEADAEISQQGLSESPGGGTYGRQVVRNASGKELPRRPSKKWIANGLLLLGGIVCLSRGSSRLGTQLAMACILKKLMKHGPASGQAETNRVAKARHEPRSRG